MRTLQLVTVPVGDATPNLPCEIGRNQLNLMKRAGVDEGQYGDQPNRDTLVLTTYVIVQRTNDPSRYLRSVVGPFTSEEEATSHLATLDDLSGEFLYTVTRFFRPSRATVHAFKQAS